MSRKSDFLKGLFASLDDQRISYIVLREPGLDFDRLTIDRDLDLLVRPSDRLRLRRSLKSRGFRHRIDSDRDHIFFYGSTPHEHFFCHRLDVHIDVIFQLMYRSPNRGEWIPAHQDIQESAWKNRVFDPDYAGRWHLAPLDEFVGTLAHVVLDKKTVTLARRERLETLLGRIDAEEAVGLLSLLFFRFAPVLLRLVKDRQWDHLSKNTLCSRSISVSNPGVFYLSSAQCKEYPPIRRFDIEDNIGESIHVHFDEMRADLTIKEFLKLAGFCRECLWELYSDGSRRPAVENLPGAFIKDFARYIGKVREVRMEKVLLKDLFCTDGADTRRGLSGVCHLGKSGLLRSLQGHPQNARQFLWQGVLRDIRRGLLTAENNHICLLEGSPVVRYGLWEALGLWASFGGDTEIFVKRILFDGSVDARLPRPAAAKWFKALVRSLRFGFKKRASP